MRIILTRRINDVHACIKGQTGVWGAGKTSYEAIGNMVSAHIKIFGIEAVEWPESQPTRPVDSTE
jgi:hypothetical protein